MKQQLPTLADLHIDLVQALVLDCLARDRRFALPRRTWTARELVAMAETRERLRGILDDAIALAGHVGPIEATPISIVEMALCRLAVAGVNQPIRFESVGGRFRLQRGLWVRPRETNATLLRALVSL